jgi:hypothetical protein
VKIDFSQREILRDLIKPDSIQNPLLTLFACSCPACCTGTGHLLIRATPLLTSVGNDALIWQQSHFGDYSVKIAYRLICDTVVTETASAPNENWCCIWKLLVPSKVRNFLWKDYVKIVFQIMLD